MKVGKRARGRRWKKKENKGNREDGQEEKLMARLKRSNDEAW